jgi:hypothetical protein
MPMTTRRTTRNKVERPAMQTLRKFYVYDPHVGDELGGVRVMKEEEGGEEVRFVLMHPVQSKYWTDIMAIGSEPLHRLHNETAKQLHHMWGGRLLKKPPAGEVGGVATEESGEPATPVKRREKGPRFKRKVE